jgi:hypothetical protein
MRKENRKHRWHVTPKEKEEIRRLTIAGVRQAVIARRLKITAPSVSKVQRAMGLPTHLVIPEQEIMRLFREGWGGYRIAKHLKVCAHCVYAVMHKNGFRRADGAGSGYADADEAGFIEAVKNHSDYANNLAPKFRIGICKGQRLARETLGVTRLLPGRSSPPLSSHESLRPCTIARLAERIIYGMFDGAPPRHPVIIATVVAATHAKLLEAEGVKLAEAGVLAFAEKLACDLRRHIGDDSQAQGLVN